jgi:hypothetical protein
MVGIAAHVVEAFIKLAAGVNGRHGDAIAAGLYAAQFETAGGGDIGGRRIRMAAGAAMQFHLGVIGQTALHFAAHVREAIQIGGKKSGERQGGAREPAGTPRVMRHAGKSSSSEVRSDSELVSSDGDGAVWREDGDRITSQSHAPTGILGQ